VPLVFIGAFFLLNLTLAVINSKFNEAHKEHTERNKLRGKKHKRNKLASIDGGDEGDISVNKFLIAKRAAAKMIDFLHKRREQRAQGKLPPLQKPTPGLEDS